jgi:hypothetical protein
VCDGSEVLWCKGVDGQCGHCSGSWMNSLEGVSWKSVLEAVSSCTA